MGEIRFMEEVFKEQEWQYLTILQKMDYVSKNGCPAGFITQHDIRDTQLAFGLTTETRQ